MIFSIPRSLKDLNSLQTEVVLPGGAQRRRRGPHAHPDSGDGGQARAARPVRRLDVKAYTTYLEALHQHPRLSGFEGDRGRDVLDGWVRSSILKEERAGLKRDKVVMGYLRPLTIASYRSGLPKSSSRNRRADDLLYQTVFHADRGSRLDKPHQGDRRAVQHDVRCRRRRWGRSMGRAPIRRAREHRHRHAARAALP